MKTFAMIALYTTSVVLSGISISAADSPAITDPTPPRRIVGWVERVELHPEKLLVDAKLAPGSEGNVLHAENLKPFTRKGKDWIRFTTTNRKGEDVLLERQIVNTTKIKTTSGKNERRYVVRSGVCIDNKYLEVSFSLANRNSFEQEIRIGRDTLAGHFIVDPAKTKATKPNCILPSNKDK